MLSGDRHVFSRLIQLLHNAKRHLTGGFACKCDGQYLLRPIHSRQQCQQPLREQLGFSRTCGRADAKAPRWIDRLAPDTLI